MVDSTVVVNQVQELEVIIHDSLVEGIIIHNTFIEHTEFFLNSHITFDVGLTVNDVFQMD